MNKPEMKFKIFRERNLWLRIVLEEPDGTITEYNVAPDKHFELDLTIKPVMSERGISTSDFIDPD